MTIQLSILLSVLSVSFVIFFGLSNKKRRDSDSVKKDSIEAAIVNVKDNFFELFYFDKYC